ncbi:Methyltransferase domain [Rubrobacter radiotolerans]|uniref:Class I SAM-dependent methyltransferase n=1 Tax=Rubrobacter radiotolerans TaxID=42256 RepID=A0A023X055_RUBRA|nr:class I SAM-dependent methyltransferase [Rubrobacter radiotolerans]AHY45405.1 Methyltransferase domain [Rubrobacter radiotolerans]MDX5892816.1 class I SAM-dependent methyltransferase [Rubrobacter radiotolerans]SMC02547.1 Methyltransferase domain-containing protein [Rubrobacter radiotolerans DSM 5868]
MAEYDPLADLYNLEYGHEYDVPFWISLAEREAGPVVEWGAGTGRISVPLARRGSRVTAVELSEKMLERGRKKNESVEWVRGDMCETRLDRIFGFGVCAFNSFLCLLDLEDALDFLKNARDHLAPGGLLGIEVSVFSPEELADPSGVANLRHDFVRPLDDGGALDRFSATRYDPATQIMDMRLFYELYDASGEMKSRRAHDLRIRLTGRDELELMLRATGFVVESVYGGFDGEPFTPESDHLIVLARNPVSD